jgi:diguanylate cyclase (GGDEF)-like protein
LESLIAMTAAECVTVEPATALDAVARAVRRFGEALSVDAAELFVDGHHVIWPNNARSVGSEPMFAESAFASIATQTADCRGTEVLKCLGLSAACETRLSGDAGLLRAVWRGTHMPTGYLYLHQALGDVLAGTLRRVAAVEALSQMAQTDGLTGVFNRAEFQRRLTAAQTTGGSQDVAILYIDLDRFKAVNDGHGHAIGDELLIACAERLSRHVRPADIVGRLGGDEFAIIAQVIDETAAHELAERIRHVLAEPYAVGLTTLRVTASVGLVYGPAHDDLNEALATADRLMYKEKRVIQPERSAEAIS